MNRQLFFDHVRNSLFGGHLTQSQVEGMTVILDEWDRRALPDIRWLAYMLATVFLETARTMQPIREYGGSHARYAPWFGRGFVQLTWKANYQKADTKLKLGGSLVANPDRALEPAIAVKILFLGMMEGWFTGHKLGDYIRGPLCAYQNARKIINGTDKAATIAGYARSFEAALRAALVGLPASDSVAPVTPLAADIPAEKPSPPDAPIPDDVSSGHTDFHAPDDPGPTPKGTPMATVGSTVSATVKSPWTSKINWVALITALMSAMAALGIVLPADWKDMILQLAGIGSPLLMIVLRTFFTKTVIANSVT